MEYKDIYTALRLTALQKTPMTQQNELAANKVDFVNPLKAAGEIQGFQVPQA